MERSTGLMVTSHLSTRVQGLGPYPGMPTFDRETFPTRNAHPHTLPFCHFTLRVPPERLKAFILKRKGTKHQPKTLGEHLRNRRLSLGLRQEDVARQLGTIREVYDRWERNKRKPVVSVWPSIVGFLAYYPGHPVASAADFVLLARRVTGLDQKALARRVGVIPQKLRRWERGKAQPRQAELQTLEGIVEAAIPPRAGFPATDWGENRDSRGPVDGPWESSIIPA